MYVIAPCGQTFCPGDAPPLSVAVRNRNLAVDNRQAEAPLYPKPLACHKHHGPFGKIRS